MYDCLADILKWDFLPALIPMLPCDDITPMFRSPVNLLDKVSGRAISNEPPRRFPSDEVENFILSKCDGLNIEKSPKR